MWIIESSKFCEDCQKHFEYNEMKLGRERFTDGERIFFTCPICGKEIEDILVNENMK